MNTSIKLAAVTVLVGLSLAATPSHAAVVGYLHIANGPSMCQAFTPGPTNTIRNRVIGAENVGTATINVACDFSSRYYSSNYGTSLRMYFSNNNPSGTISVTCTMLTGYQTGTNKLATKTIDVTAGVQNSLLFVPTDLDSTFTTFNSPLIGVNCALPPGGVINDTYYGYNEENGVGS